MSEQLPWWFRLDEWLHNHIDPHLGRRAAAWRLVYFGPRRWFCEWADRRLQIEQLRGTAELAMTMCLKPLTTTSASGGSVSFRCDCPRHRAETEQGEK